MSTVHLIALLLPFSILGLLVRLGLQALVSYDPHAVFPLAYPQFVGCFVMGLAIPLKDRLVSVYPPIYTAITTGFCGSLTTFSGWQLDVFNSWINASGAKRSGLDNFVDGFTKSVFTLLISLAGLVFASTLIPQSVRDRSHHSRLPNAKYEYAILAFSVAIYAATFPAYFLLPPSYRHKATAALLFASPGALTRYVASVYLNRSGDAFPMGTFTVNIIGTMLLSAFTVLQHVSSSPVSSNACSILQGLSDGFCGCLTTISTFAAEILILNLSAGVKYVAVSYLTGQLAIFAIYGSALLSHHSGKIQTCGFE